VWNCAALHAGLNKGEVRNALARAVFLCCLGEIRDRSFEQQRYRASGLTLVTAAIALWNTVYIERAVQISARDGQALDPELFKYLSPLGWSTSTSPATTNGRAPGLHRADLGLSVPLTTLNVLYCPFSEGAPIWLFKLSDGGNGEMHSSRRSEADLASSGGLWASGNNGQEGWSAAVMYGFDVGLHRSEPGTRRRLRLALAYINFRFVRCPQRKQASKNWKERIRQGDGAP